MRAVEKRLRARIKELEAKLEKVEDDRTKLRDAFVRNLREALHIHGEGKYWNMSSLIETFARQMQGFEKWWWC